ncbi:ATP-grasp enzyme [Rhodococcus sp. Leaf7]|uniref:ATP-grasp enzyme n=1 Tax=unclassified Rhodococcus (in: high G+C Gram-positive bacteria) TaxID=192944 RepID=UPI0005AC841E|nr:MULTISPECIES: ATP-grasp enzyme [unclassified Rhodococcus (in: high G+C Gram-positive bacteria)]KIQ19903.1 ATP-grasp enzyme [Rhodococcus sp. MEB064]KQU06612.1 ATP-grasp enzyme [Rhodococcus sp. Leaf7]KQU42131.1 ATP-grasp enzyme [Rhodococcus sp. Leaf247]
MRGTTGRSVTALAVLALTAPLDLIAVATTVGSRRTAPGTPARERRTVLINGGKMTKSLQLARSFHGAGHRVVLVESAKYRYTAHRFSRAVDVFHTVPEASDVGYAEAVAEIARRENADVFVPVSSPASSVPDAEVGRLLAGVCDVIHVDSATVAMLDDKVQFSKTAESLGLRVPQSHLITDRRQLLDFDFPPGRRFILKRIAYNPVGRMDLTPLSRDTPDANAEFISRLSVSADDPWILQEFVDGQEYCTHSTVRNGRVQVYGCCESSAFQINYAMVDKPEIRSWVEHFVGELGLTGQVSFDFIEGADGHPYAIECNPRTHSAITMFHDHPDVAAAYLEDGHPVITPLPTARPTYWLYHEVWRLLTEPGRVHRLRTILGGKDAVFTRWDPLPYFMLYHLHLPSLLWANLRKGGSWSRVDANIGKLVEAGGD